MTGDHPTPSRSWLDQAITAGDDEMIAAYLDELLGPLPPPHIEPTNDYEHQLMRWSMLSAPTLPTTNPITLIASSGC